MIPVTELFDTEYILGQGMFQFDKMIYQLKYKATFHKISTKEIKKYKRFAA